MSFHQHNRHNLVAAIEGHNALHFDVMCIAQERLLCSCNLGSSANHSQTTRIERCYRAVECILQWKSFWTHREGDALSPIISALRPLYRPDYHQAAYCRSLPHIAAQNSDSCVTENCNKKIKKKNYNTTVESTSTKYNRTMKIVSRRHSHSHSHTVTVKLSLPHDTQALLPQALLKTPDSH